MRRLGDVGVHEWSVNHGEEAKIQMEWPHLKILWHGRENSAGDSEMSKTKMCEDSIKEWTGMGLGIAWRQRKMGNVLLHRHPWCPDAVSDKDWLKAEMIYLLSKTMLAEVKAS